MRKLKTDNLEVVIRIENDGMRCFQVAMTDKDEPLEEPQHIFRLPLALTKQNFNEAKFLKHLLNFFIKE